MSKSTWTGGKLFMNQAQSHQIWCLTWRGCGRLKVTKDNREAGIADTWLLIQLGCRQPLSLLDKLTPIIKLTSHTEMATHTIIGLFSMFIWYMWYVGMPSNVFWPFDSHWWYFDVSVMFWSMHRLSALIWYNSDGNDIGNTVEGSKSAWTRGSCNKAFTGR